MDNYLGEIRLFAGDYAPQGWAFCDGSTLDIASNEALFALIGTTFGGNGQTTFSLPDLRGRVVLHQGTGSDGSTYQRGDQMGTETVTLMLQQIPSHNHSMNVSTSAGATNNPTGALISVGMLPGYRAPTDDDRVQFNQNTIGFAGGSQPHNNMMPFIVVNYIIATTGYFPSPT